MTTKEVDIPEFLKDKNKDSNWITVKKQNFISYLSYMTLKSKWLL